jgi:8-oxo-dGTP pyrophosphatase MutT (NUDIX family)
VALESFAANPRPAATVVVMRDSPRGPEVFMVRRHGDAAFMGGAYVFPGGRVEANDYDDAAAWCDGIERATAQLGGVAADTAIAYHVAAARELFEEAGVLLARDASARFVPLADAQTHTRFSGYRADVQGGLTPLRTVLETEGLRLALDALVLFAHWVTPPIDTRQFDTRFFMTRIPPDQAPVHDDRETTDSDWIAPAEAIARSRGDDFVLPPPTWTTLRELERFGSVDEALGWARARRVVRRQPELRVEAGVRTLVIPGDPQHPDEPGDEIPRETRFTFVGSQWRAVLQPPRD